MAFFSNIFSSSRASGTSQIRDLNQVLDEIESRLQRQASDILENWQRDAEKQMGESVSSLMNGLLDSLGGQLGAKTPAPRIDFGDALGASGSLDRAFRPFENQVNRWIRSTVDEWFTSEKTTVTSSQSTRSSEALNKFRESRSQQQSQAAQNVQQGQRNL